MSTADSTMHIRKPRRVLSLRRKLALALSVAAILPVLVGAVVSLRVVLTGLEDSLRQQAARQVRVAVSLVLRQVERVGADAGRLARAPALAGAIDDGERAVKTVLIDEEGTLPSALVQVLAPDGHVVVTHAVGQSLARYGSLAAAPSPKLVAAGLRFERRVTLTRQGDLLVVRAVAPVVDAEVHLAGVVVMSVPLDDDVAEQLKSALGNDVILFAGDQPGHASFVDELGGRLPPVSAPPGVLPAVLSGASRHARLEVRGQAYTLGISPLKDLDGTYVGALAVAMPREGLQLAQRAAFGALAVGAIGALLFALGLAVLLGRRLTAPLRRLHAGALAVARGDLDVELPPARGGRGGGDELDDLSGAFTQMTASLRQSRARLDAFSSELELKVKDRTQKLSTINMELGKTLAELRDTQAQLILSERLAGLGTLVAGVAHEINSPTAAVRGAIDALAGNVERMAAKAAKVVDHPDLVSSAQTLARATAELRLPPPLEVRAAAKAFVPALTAAGVAEPEATGRALAELGLHPDRPPDAVPEPLPREGSGRVTSRDTSPTSKNRELAAIVALARLMPALAASGRPGLDYLLEAADLHRNVASIRTAIGKIQRIVGALKSYTHLDQAKIESVNLEDGLEDTLVILHHELKYGIVVTRNFAPLPRVPVYVDELNQVWTNLIHNAVQALGGQGELTLETEGPPAGTPAGEGYVTVRVIDGGPGIPEENLQRVFEPFFTTKAKGEGTGLGLGIVRDIIAKHGGSVDIESRPGRTCVSVRLPVAGPPR